MIITAIALFLTSIILTFIVWFLFSRYKSRGVITRALNMTLFLVRLPREFPKEGQQQKQDKELIGVMEQLLSSFTSLHSKGWNKFSYGEPYLGLELAVHHIGEEIHFYFAAPKAHEGLIEKQIHGFYPTAEITKVKDYNIFGPQGITAGSHFNVGNSPVLPFKTYQKLETDPLGEILTSMSKLEEEGEGAALQILIKPSHNSGLKSLALKVSKEMQKGSDFSEALRKSSKSKTQEFIEFANPSTSSSPQEKPEEKPKVVTPYHEETVKALIQKSSRPLFDVNIRALASANTKDRAEQILQDLENVFVQFSSPDLNSLKPIRAKKRKLQKLIFNFSFRLFDEKQNIYLSTEELASIYHFPLPTTAAPRVKLLKAKPAEPPADLPKEGIILGKNIYRGQEKEIRMQRDDRRRHLYIIGQTGTGKTSFLGNLIKQDIWNSEGVCVIDPHGDLIEDVLESIPKERVEDVIVFNPADLERPLGLNMLEIDPSKPEQKTFVANEILAIVRSLYKDIPEAFGPMFDQYFKNSILLLLDDYQNEVPTLAEIPKVLSDSAYRKDKLSREKNPLVKNFWELEAEKAGGEASLANMTPYITSKLNPFLANDYVRPIVIQKQNAFNFRDVIDNRKILLVNLSKGRIGDINANLLGLITVGKLLMAAFSRVDIPQEQRNDFNLYIDEFQNFTTDTIAVILSEARKYRLNLIIAHQFIKQLQENIKNSVFGNVGSMVVFRIGAEDAEFMKNQFEPVFSTQDLMNIDNFNAYVKLLINNQTSRPFNIQIIPPQKGYPEMAQYIKELSRQKYSKF